MSDDAGILALWNDCAEAGEADYERWYMAQHLPERVGVPGFRFGRRYQRLSGDRKYFSFYETDSPSVLWSPTYLERLGNPTEWTQRVMPHFQNTIRTACRKAGSGGHAMGGCVVTFRFMDLGYGHGPQAAAFCETLLPELLQADGVCHAHLWLAAEEQTPTKTAETDLRGPDELVAWAVVLETTHEDAALRLCEDPALASRIAGMAAGERPFVGAYRLLCVLDGGMLPAE